MSWSNDTYSNWTATEKTCPVICNNKGPDQPAHPLSLIRNFVVCFLRRLIPRLASCGKKSIFYLARLTEWTGLDSLCRNPEDRFFGIVACVACSTALGQIFQVQQIIILKGGCSSDIFTATTLFDCTLHHLIHKSFVATAHRAGARRGLWFSGYRSLV